MRNLTGLLAATLLALTGATAEAAPRLFGFARQPRAPIVLSLAWVTAPCHPDGRVVITVTNISDRELAMPIQGPLAADGLFKGAARVGKEKKPVYSDNLAPPSAPPGLGDVLPVRPLGPDQSTTYRVDFNRGNTAADGRIALDTAYARIRQSGGEIWVVYALPRAPDPSQPYVVASDNPILSNKLTCPA
ncbi:MAG: hypothetical protein HY859_13315 [Caulobacterales bacterium]|nr:hypothetical protein [Caulobacterales bacterium]